MVFYLLGQIKDALRGSIKKSKGIILLFNNFTSI
jgi:hypothetical protein